MSGQQPSLEQQHAYLSKVKQELQSQMIQDLMTKVTENCFKTCTGKRGDGLDSSEKNCLTNCMDRYMDTMSTVHKTLNERQQNH